MDQAMRRPNILVLLTDDQPFRSATEEHMPQSHAAVAARGLTYGRAYVAVPRCGPSRAAFLTGLYPGDPADPGAGGNGIFVNGHASKRFRALGRHRECLPYHLATEAGYRCALFGKWLNMYAETQAFVPPGFVRWYSSVSHDDPVKVNDNGRIKRADYGRSGETRELADRAVAFLERAGSYEEPFFCVVAFNSPHMPAHPSRANEGSYSGVPMWGSPGGLPSFNPDQPDPNKPREVREEPRMTGAEVQDLESKWRRMMEEVRDADDAKARIVGATDLSETFVFDMTDNSTLWGEHRLRAKSQPYEEAVRTHLWVAGPAAPEDQARDDLVCNVDVTATAYELAGLDDRAAWTDGRSLLPSMMGAEDREERGALLVALPPDPDPAKRFEGWKAIRTVYPDDRLYVEHGTGEKELYDMAADPFQLSSLQNAPDRMVEIDALSARLRGLSGSSGAGLREAEGVA